MAHIFYGDWMENLPSRVFTLFRNLIWMTNFLTADDRYMKGSYESVKINILTKFYAELTENVAKVFVYFFLVTKFLTPDAP